VRSEPDQVGVEAGQFGEQHAHPLSLVGDGQFEELFDGQTVTEVVVHRAEVVDAIGEGNDLLVELGFAGFFDAGVQVADFGIKADDDFAIDLEHQAQDAVRRWMLRTHVEDHGLVGGALGDGCFEDQGSCHIGHQSLSPAVLVVRGVTVSIRRQLNRIQREASVKCECGV
jgi:hypothetical protein